MSEKYLTAKEVSSQLGVKPITIRVWLTKGLFPNAKLEEIEPFGKIWRIPENDLINFKKPEMGRPRKKLAETENAVPSIHKKCFLVEKESHRIFELSPTKICTIGRSPENIVALTQDRYISIYHARIVFEEGDFVLYDGGIAPDGKVRPSVSGTFANGLLCKRFVLFDGCEISSGSSKFIYREEN